MFQDMSVPCIHKKKCFKSEFFFFFGLMKNIRSNFKYFLFLQIEKQYIHNYTNKINRNKTFNILLHVYIQKIKSKYCTPILHMLKKY